MKKKKNKIKKLLTIMAILTLNSLGFMNSVVYATPEINSAYMYSVGDCGQLLKYRGVIVITDYVQYSYNGVNYPAYCLDKTKVRCTGTTI